MLLRFRKTWSMVLIILLFMLLWMLAESYSQKPIGDETDSTEFRKYVSQDVEECSRIQVLCIPGREYFLDETGCGCELVSEDDKQKVYCKEEQRKAEACIEIYQPVCGFPLNKTFSNSCFACMDEQVEYHIQGECQ